MLSKKEALFRLNETAILIGANDTKSGIRHLYDKYHSSTLDELAKQIVAHEFGLKNVQWIHTEWDWLDVEYRGKFCAYFKAIMPGFDNEQPVYLVFEGSYADSDPDWDYIYPNTVYTQSEWEQARLKAINDMQTDSCLATYLTVS